jgi:hypothetical protein
MCVDSISTGGDSRSYICTNVNKELQLAMSSSELQRERLTGCETMVSPTPYLTYCVCSCVTLHACLQTVRRFECILVDSHRGRLPSSCLAGFF